MKDLRCLNRIRVDHGVFVPHHPVNQHLSGHISIMPLRSMSLIKAFLITQVNKFCKLTAARVDHVI